MVKTKASSDKESEYSNVNTGELAEVPIRHSGDGQFCIKFKTDKEWRISPQRLRMTIQPCTRKNMIVKRVKALFFAPDEIDIFQDGTQLHVEANVSTEGNNTPNSIQELYNYVPQSHHRFEVNLNLGNLSQYACKAINVNLTLMQQQEECHGDFHLHLETLELLGDLLWPLDFST